MQRSCGEAEAELSQGGTLGAGGAQEGVGEEGQCPRAGHTLSPLQLGQCRDRDDPGAAQPQGAWGCPGTVATVLAGSSTSEEDVTNPSEAPTAHWTGSSGCGEEPQDMDRAVHGHQGLGRILGINFWYLSMSTGKEKMQTFQYFQYFTPLFWEQGDNSSSETLLSTDVFLWIQSYEDKFFYLCYHKPNNPTVLRDPAVSAMHWPGLTLVQKIHECQGFPQML